MASTPFTLAALATSAVPGLTVNGTRPHTSGSAGAFVSAVLATDRGDVIVRVPANAGAEVQQSAELLGLAALAEGARAALPFAVPETLGMTRAGDTRAIVSTFLPGVPVSLDRLEGDPELLRRTAEAIAAIHSLPASLVRDGGLPSRDSAEVRSVAARLVQHAAESGMLPATVRARWEEVLNTPAVWSFDPIVVHGSLAPEMLLLDEQGLTGILGWNELSLGDPANDLAWLLDADPGTFEAALAHYQHERSIAGQRELTARARFYHELEVAKWLLHGIESHDQAIVNDAVGMFDRLVDRLGLLGQAVPQRRVLSEHEVEQLLEETPALPIDPRSETAEYESLDEDRAFGGAPEFAEGAGDAAAQVAGEDAGASAAEDAAGPSANSGKNLATAPAVDPDSETGVLDDAVTDLDRRER